MDSNPSSVISLKENESKRERTNGVCVLCVWAHKTVGQINILRNFKNWLVCEETGREINEYLVVARPCCALDGRASPSGSSSKGSALTYPAVSPEAAAMVLYQPSVPGFAPGKNALTLPWDVFLSPSHRQSLSSHWLDEPRAVQLRNSPQRSHQEVLLISTSEFLMLHICSQRVGWGGEEVEELGYRNQVGGLY